MTIVNNNTTAHSGLLVTGSGDGIDIEVEVIGGRTLRMSSAGDELGTWPIDDCHIEPDETRRGSFRIVVDGDDALFTPVDPVGFRSLVSVVSGTDPEWLLPELDGPAETVDSNPQPAPVADPDDTVAFLFGSTPAVPSAPDPAPPPVPAIEVPAPVPTEAANVAESPLDIPVALEATVPISVDPTDAPESEPVRHADLTEDDTYDVGLAVETAVEPEPFDTEDDFVLSDEAEVPPDEPERGLRSRFGGSSLDKLSAAIGAVKSQNASATEVRDTEEDYVLAPNTVADEVLSSQRTLREHQMKDAKRGKRLKIVGIAAGAAVIALLTLLAPRAISFVQNYEGGAEPPPPLEVSATTVPPTVSTIGESVVDLDGDTTPSIPAEGAVSETLFDRPAPEFVARWDATGGAIDEVLRFDSYPIVGPFEERFTPYLTGLGVVEPAGTLGSFSLVIDPSGPAQYDRIGIQALGVAVATFDPERSPEGRATLLAQLGLNVRQPLLAGIDGTVTIEDIAYSLVYDDTTTLLTLTVAPAG